MSRVLVTGGAGFIGSHLCRALLGEGHEVACVDSEITGRRENVADLQGNPRFRYALHDVSRPLPDLGGLDVVFHLASPASPKDYERHPVETLRACALGTLEMLDLSASRGALLVLASTSEVYGDPEVHPQTEEYWGHVNPVGPRSHYDEGKRFAEAASMAYRRLGRVRCAIARIFNTYGPGMRSGDGRAVPTFITQALSEEPLTVYGDGSQTRSLCYVDDLVQGLLALRRAEDPGPYNLGNPEELTVLELARLILELTGSSSRIENRPLPQDDPRRRRPDVTRATEALGWRPRVSVREGLARTVEYFRSRA